MGAKETPEGKSDTGGGKFMKFTMFRQNRDFERERSRRTGELVRIWFLSRDSMNQIKSYFARGASSTERGRGPRPKAVVEGPRRLRESPDPLRQRLALPPPSAGLPPVFDRRSP